MGGTLLLRVLGALALALPALAGSATGFALDETVPVEAPDGPRFYVRSYYDSDRMMGDVACCGAGVWLLVQVWEETNGIPGLQASSACSDGTFRPWSCPPGTRVVDRDTLLEEAHAGWRA